jgi:hypothetical protein
MLLLQSPSWKLGKSRKIKNRFLMFARLSAEKGNTVDCLVIEKAKSEKSKLF